MESKEMGNGKMGGISIEGILERISDKEIMRITYLSQEGRNSCLAGGLEFHADIISFFVFVLTICVEYQIWNLKNKLAIK